VNVRGMAQLFLLMRDLPKNLGLTFVVRTMADSETHVVVVIGYKAMKHQMSLPLILQLVFPPMHSARPKEAKGTSLKSCRSSVLQQDKGSPYPD